MSDYPRQLRDFGSYNVMCEAADYIERIEAQLAEAERKLRVYGQHLPNCRSLVYLTSMPPKTQPCDCGLVTPDSAEAAADVFAAMNLPTHTFPSITSSAHKPGCAVFSVSPFRAQRPDCDCGADLAAPDQPEDAGKNGENDAAT